MRHLSMCKISFLLLSMSTLRIPTTVKNILFHYRLLTLTVAFLASGISISNRASSMAVSF